MKQLLMVLLAGAAGTYCRYLLSRPAWNQSFPWATLGINVFGAFSAGFLFSFLSMRFTGGARWFPALFIGFFGAFTTFSTFALDCAKMIDAADYLKFAANLSLQLVLGVIAACAGLWLGRIGAGGVG